MTTVGILTNQFVTGQHDTAFLELYGNTGKTLRAKESKRLDTSFLISGNAHNEFCTCCSADHSASIHFELRGINKEFKQITLGCRFFEDEYFEYQGYTIQANGILVLDYQWKTLEVTSSTTSIDVSGRQKLEDVNKQEFQESIEKFIDHMAHLLKFEISWMAQK